MRISRDERDRLEGQIVELEEELRTIEQKYVETVRLLNDNVNPGILGEK